MPFTLCVKRTVNGEARILRLRGCEEHDRPYTDDVIAAFAAGRLPLEATWTISSGGDGPDDPAWIRSWRWADIKAIWIEG